MGGEPEVKVTVDKPAKVPAPTVIACVNLHNAT